MRISKALAAGSIAFGHQHLLIEVSNCHNDIVTPTSNSMAQGL